jgi:hypothetical protein
MKKRPVAWESLIQNCPHCGYPLRIHHVSTIDQKHLVGMLYQSLYKHYLEDCLLNYSPKCIDIEVEIQNELNGNYYSKLCEYENIKLIV